MWIDRPRKLPFIDPLTGTGDPDAGPYYETPLVYFPYSPEGWDERLMTLAISATYLRDISRAPGSPGLFVDKDEHAALVAEHHRLTEEVADLNAKLEYAKAEIERISDPDRDVLVLADKIAERLGSHNVKRGPGRPPKAA